MEVNLVPRNVIHFENTGEVGRAVNGKLSLFSEVKQFITLTEKKGA